jgi:hypothetical protein
MFPRRVEISLFPCSTVREEYFSESVVMGCLEEYFDLRERKLEEEG